jgi:protein TonB
MNKRHLSSLLILLTFIIYPSISNGQTDSSKAYQEIVGNEEVVTDPKKVIEPKLSAKMLDQQPQFPGGMAGWKNHLIQNLKYPEKAQRKGKSGRVVLQFVVEKDGSLTDIKVKERVGGGCDEEAVRVLKLSPLWKPGILKGKPVRVQYTAPIVFAFTN